MPYPTKDDLVEMLKTRRHIDIVNEHLISGLPYFFRSAAPLYDTFVAGLAPKLVTPPEDISVIGSARIGFSLDPDKFGAAFTATSDIDTIVVNAELFDAAWFDLCTVGRRRLLMGGSVQRAFSVHRSNNVFFGFIIPDALPGIVRLSAHWFGTFQRLGRLHGLAGVEINGRLYRTWDHVRAHQLYSLECIAAKLKI